MNDKLRTLTAEQREQIESFKMKEHVSALDCFYISPLFRIEREEKIKMAILESKSISDFTMDDLTNIKHALSSVLLSSDDLYRIRLESLIKKVSEKIYKNV